jgi:hypothetical protein
LPNQIRENELRHKIRWRAALACAGSCAVVLAMAPGAVLPASAATPVLEGGAVAAASNLIIAGVPITINSSPEVTTPPNGGQVSANGGRIDLPSASTSLLTITQENASSTGLTTNGGSVASASNVLDVNLHLPGFPGIPSLLPGLPPIVPPLPGLGLLDIQAVQSTCDATPTVQAAQSSFAAITVLGVALPISPGVNTAIPLAILGNGAKIVLNEQIPGSTQDGHPGIEVNAVHIYGPIQANGVQTSLVLAESACEFSLAPTPIVPESHLPLLLPLSAIPLAGAAVLFRRRRRRMVTTAI